MLTYEEANQLIDAEDNRHRRKGKATIMIGVTGPYKRYIWLNRVDGDDAIHVTLLGHTIAYMYPDGISIDHCGEITPTTRLAFETLIGRRVWNETPGSRGGKPGEHKMLVVFDGECHEVRREGLFIPAESLATL